MLEVAVATVPVAFLLVLDRASSAGATVAIAGTLLGVYWIGLAFAHAELLRELPHGNGVLDRRAGRHVPRRHRPPTSAGGCSAAGRWRRRSRPNKTVEGLFCGMLVAILAVFFAGLYQTWLTQGDALLLGVAVAVLGPLGDLFESLVKRDAGAKDAGTLFGAHGGALDRLDAAIFTVVAGYYIWSRRASTERVAGRADRVLDCPRCPAAWRSSARPARSASRRSTSSRARARELSVVALSAASAWEPLVEQARAHGVRRIALADRDAAARAGEAWTEGEVLAGPDGLVRLITESECDMVLNAIVGSAGLRARPSRRSARASTWRWPTRSRWSSAASS